MAANICGGDLKVLDSIREHHQQVEVMPPLAVAIMVLDDWGADIPSDLIAKADCVRVNTPGTLELH